MPSSPFPLWSLEESVSVTVDDDGLVVSSRWEDVRLHRPGPVVRTALHRMGLGPVLLTNVVDGGASDPELHTALTRLHAMVVLSLGTDSLRGPLLSVVPIDPRATFRFRWLSPDETVQLAAAVSLRPDGTGFVVESPFAYHQVLCHWPEAVWVLAMLSVPITCAEVSAVVPLPPPVTMSVLGYVAAAGMLRLSREPER